MPPNFIQQSRNSLHHRRNEKAKRNLSLQDVCEKPAFKEVRKKKRACKEKGNEQKGIVKQKNRSPTFQKCI